MDDWSVLSDVEANLTEDTRRALAELSADQRRGLSQSLGTIVNRRLEEMIHPWFSRNAHDWANVDVYAAELRDGELVLHFIADHYNYNVAQSGSDWADHYLFAGQAVVVNGKRKRETFTLEREVHMTEHEDADYDPRAARNAMRGELRATVRGEQPSRAAFDAVVRAAREGSTRRAADARATYEAERAVRKPDRD